MRPWDHRKQKRTRFHTYTVTGLRRTMRTSKGFHVMLWTPIGWHLTNRTQVLKALRGVDSLDARISVDSERRCLYVDWPR